MKENVSVLISQQELEARIEKMAEQINRDYEGESVHLICILKGSIFFTCELAKYITVPVTIDFMSVSSYGDDTKSSGIVKIIKDLDSSVKGCDILLVEDIVDTGRTISTVVKTILHKGADSVKIVTLLDKPSRRTSDVMADYIGFTVPDEFVVGFGMDYNQKFRCLPYIGVLKDSVYKNEE